MCGIVGLLIKAPALREQLGELMVPMLIAMTERGPDSSGMAVFTDKLPTGERKLSLYCSDPEFNWEALEGNLRVRFGELSFHRRANHVSVRTTEIPEEIRSWLKLKYPAVHILGTGRAMDLYKDVGVPADIAARYGFHELTGTHLVGHTRMATESAVTPQNAHPYTAGEDWCLVHNGSLANPHSLQRMLETRGLRFESDCDTEAACRYLSWRLSEGDDLETALHRAFEDFDGFFTFLMGTQEKLAVVRDPFACKPAIVAETDEYVAVASEFRSLAHLPHVGSARVFEPKPGEIYSWSL